jgi:CheY-like chemotaxis protein
MEHNGAEPPAILVVDDEFDVSDMLVRLIRHLVPTATVSAVLSAAQAIAVLNVQRIDVVCTDVQMPDMSGAELTGLIKTRWPHTRVILLSGSTKLSLRDVERAVQADAYLAKPFSRVELAAVLFPLLEG